MVGLGRVPGPWTKPLWPGEEYSHWLGVDQPQAPVVRGAGSVTDNPTRITRNGPTGCTSQRKESAITIISSRRRRKKGKEGALDR